MSQAVTVLAPLAVEAWAVRGRRIGMGARQAELGEGPLAIAGLCGAVDPSLRPGDLVVASELRSREGDLACPAAGELVPLLAERGLRVHLGPIVSLDHIAGPDERLALRGSGALAVDMESAWLAVAAAPRPVVVLRAVVDRAGRRLLDPRTPAAGIRGLLALRRAAPALHVWATRLGEHVELGQRAEEVSR